MSATDRSRYRIFVSLDSPLNQSGGQKVVRARLYPSWHESFEDLDRADSFEECLELLDRIARCVELVLQCVEEQRLDRLEDVGGRTLVLTEVTAGAGRDDGLEHRAEDVGVDLAPDELAGVDELLPGLLREPRDDVVRRHREEPAVDVGKRREVAGFVRRLGRVECCEQVGEELCRVRSVVESVGPDRVRELILGEDAGVLGEVAEQQACEEQVEGVASMRLFEEVGVRVQELVEELAHALSGLHIGVRLGDVLGLLHPGPREEEREVLVDLADGEPDGLIGLGVVRDELYVVGDDDEPRAEADHVRRLLQSFEDRQGVAVGLLEVDDLLLGDLTHRIGSDVEVAVAQARDAALRFPVGEQEVEDELAVVRVTTRQRGNAFLDHLEVEPRHVVHLSFTLDFYAYVPGLVLPANPQWFSLTARSAILSPESDAVPRQLARMSRHVRAPSHY